jgi:hypothetical protein
LRPRARMRFSVFTLRPNENGRGRSGDPPSSPQSLLGLGNIKYGVATPFLARCLVRRYSYLRTWRRMVKLMDMHTTYHFEPAAGAPRRVIAGSGATARDIAVAGAVVAALVNFSSGDSALARIDF